MLLEGRQFGQLIKSDCCFTISSSARISAPRSQVLEQRLQTMDGPSLRGGLGALLGFDRFRGLRLSDGVTSPSIGIKFIILEKNRREGLTHVPLNVVGQHAQKDVCANVRLCTVPDWTYLKVDTFHAPEGLFNLPETLVGAHGILRA